MKESNKIRLLKQIRSATVLASDGDVGTVTDCFLDEDLSRARYLVVDVGSWKPGGRILVSVSMVSGIDLEEGAITLSLSREQFKRRPILNQPATIVQLEADQVPSEVDQNVSAGGRLTSARQLAGLHVQANDNDEVGHVDDLIVNSASWAIEGVLIDTSNMPGGKWITVPPELVSSIGWVDQKVFLNASGDQVRNSPEYQEPESAARF